MYCPEHILEATPHKTVVVRPPTSHLENHPNKTNKICGALLKKQGRTHKWHSLMDLFTWTCQCWLISKNLHTCNFEDLLRERKRESQGTPCCKRDLMKNTIRLNPLESNVDVFNLQQVNHAKSSNQVALCLYLQRTDWCYIQIIMNQATNEWSEKWALGKGEYAKCQF